MILNNIMRTYIFYAFGKILSPAIILCRKRILIRAILILSYCSNYISLILVYS